MDVQDPKEQFEDKPMDEEAEEQEVPSEVAPSPDTKPGYERQNLRRGYSHTGRDRS